MRYLLERFVISDLVKQLSQLLAVRVTQLRQFRLHLRQSGLDLGAGLLAQLLDAALEVRQVFLQRVLRRRIMRPWDYIVLLAGDITKPKTTLFSYDGLVSTLFPFAERIRLIDLSQISLFKSIRVIWRGSIVLSRSM